MKMMAAGKRACISAPNEPRKQSETADGAAVMFTRSPQERRGWALAALEQIRSSSHHC